MAPALHSAAGSLPLPDRFGRFHNYLRISLTERCNLRCTYCMPAHGVDLAPPETMLTDEEVLFLAAFFAARGGARKIRLTGGEPLVRPGIVDIVRALAAIDQLPALPHRVLAAIKQAQGDNVS